MQDIEPRNQRERVSLRGWRSKDARLVELAHLDQWRSMRDTSGWEDALEKV